MHHKFIICFYKTQVTDIKVVISYQFVFAEHEYDIQIAKLVLVFFKLQSERNKIYIMKCTSIAY